MPQEKINDRRLLQLIDKEGLSQSAAARELGVTRQAVSLRLKDLRGLKTRAVVASKLNESIDASFNAMQQLTAINNRAIELLDQAEGDPELCLKCIGELRQQIKLASEIYERMYSIQVVNEFMQTVADTFRECNRDVYEDFKRRINANRSVCGAVQFR